MSIIHIEREGRTLKDDLIEMKGSGRLVALDAFRGATMALMVLVNNAGDGDNSYNPLKHSQWNGWTITDVVFPTFLFIVGIAITLSMQPRLERGVTTASLLWPVIRRALILYALGLFVYLFPHFDFSTMRVMGVLQRIGICYLAASLIFLWLPAKTRTRWTIVSIVVLLSGYWLLMKTVPVPGYGTGRLDVEGNLAHYVDRVVLGLHNYRRTATWDPEGIVSTLPAIATVLFGVLAGEVLRTKRSLWEKMTLLFVTGNALLATGLICDIWLPINKKLWTSSFAVFMAGMGFVLLATFLYLVEERGYQRWFQPFVILGRNAIVVYLLSEIVAIVLDETKWQGRLYRTLFVPLASPANASLLWALAFTFVMFLAAYGMYQKNWVVKI